MASIAGQHSSAAVTANFACIPVSPGTLPEIMVWYKSFKSEYSDGNMVTKQ